MNPQSEKSPLPHYEPLAVLPIVSQVQRAQDPSITMSNSDRLYQIAALTAGAFLLATLL